MAELSAKSFLDLVQRSGIVSEERLKKALAELSRQAAGRPVKLDELSKFLLAEDLITPWHYEKLITGKYRGFFIGQYKLLKLLGSGGMSSVYLAEHSLSGHRRAIKVLPRRRIGDKSYLDRFYREGRAAASLNHPNIVRIYDLCNEKDLHFMVMEYVNGIDLFQKIKDDGPASISDALSYIEQAAGALEHAHARKIVHRDIKPANLLLAADNSVKILDLGLALLRDESESLTVLYNEKVMGTADYLAPEQAVNSHNVDHRADIYSLGCTLYYLLTGKPPFPEGTIAQRIAMHQTKEPKPLVQLRPDCPAIIQTLCSKMMKKNPDERIQNCVQLMQAIEQCRTVLKAKTRPATNGLHAPTGLQRAAVGSSVATSPIVGSKQIARADPVVASTVKPTTQAAPTMAQVRSDDKPPNTQQTTAAIASDARKQPTPPDNPIAAQPSQQTARPQKGPSPKNQTIAAASKSVPIDSEFLAAAVTHKPLSRRVTRAKSTKNQLIIASMVLVCFVALLVLVLILANTFG